MSYEGYVQNICSNGHRFDSDCEEEDPHCSCGARPHWSNSVDETNGESSGIILQEDFDLFLLEEKVSETCNLGHEHVTKKATYRFPSEKERKALKCFYEEDEGFFAINPMAYNEIKDELNK